MKTVKLSAKTGNCSFFVGDRIENLARRCGTGRVVIITDKNIRALCKDAIAGFDVIEIGTGDNAKTLRTVEKIYERFLDLGVDRSSFIVGIGGGAVCDVTGFAASTYMRGLRFGFVPTTLLAQIDASIGGKNGVNLNGYKNLIGTIKQPDFCLLDFGLLKTLPKGELASGLAEAVKYGAIADPGLFAYLEVNYKKVLSVDRAAIERVVTDSLKVKIGVIEEDEAEKWERMKLNFGHTFGHAIEKASKISHGSAVSIGMVIAAELSVSKGMLSRGDARRIESLLASIGLPTSLRADKKIVLDAMLKDKKRRGGVINMVLLKKIGRAEIVEVPVVELVQILDDSAVAHKFTL